MNGGVNNRRRLQTLSSSPPLAKAATSATIRLLIISSTTSLYYTNGLRAFRYAYVAFTTLLIVGFFLPLVPSGAVEA